MGSNSSKLWSKYPKCDNDRNQPLVISWKLGGVIDERPEEFANPYNKKEDIRLYCCTCKLTGGELKQSSSQSSDNRPPFEIKDYEYDSDEGCIPMAEGYKEEENEEEDGVLRGKTRDQRGRDNSDDECKLLMDEHPNWCMDHGCLRRRVPVTPEGPYALGRFDNGRMSRVHVTHGCMFSQACCTRITEIPIFAPDLNSVALRNRVNGPEASIGMPGMAAWLCHSHRCIHCYASTGRFVERWERNNYDKGAAILCQACRGLYTTRCA